MAPKFEMPGYAVGSLPHWKMVLTRYFERIEIERKDRMLNEEQLSAHVKLASTNETTQEKATLVERKARTEVWLRDSLLWTLEEIEAGHYVHALRGLLQAASYAGMVGHDSQTGDCFTCLKNALESVCDFVVREGQS